jgi:UDP-N-acetylglucosamine 2-epimerase (non-hydrolysing)
MDVGRHGVLAALQDVERDHPDRFVLVEALGREYPRVLASVDVVVGNSSSGVIEAATVHVPAVDVGDRQRGRLRAGNVLHADEGLAPVAEAVRTALTPEWRARSRATDNPYGDGGAAPRILDIVREAVGGDRVKEFVDLCSLPERGAMGTEEAQ